MFIEFRAATIEKGFSDGKQSDERQRGNYGGIRSKHTADWRANDARKRNFVWMKMI